MNVNIKQLQGSWTLGYSLDKHTISSTPTGENSFGYMQFDTVRGEAGESLFQLKNRSDFTQVPLIAQQLMASFNNVFSTAELIVPMPSSKVRDRQPVVEIAKEFANLKGIPCYENLLVKTRVTPAMKDIDSKKEKISILTNAFAVNDMLPNGSFDVLIIDDIFDTGSSLEVATNVLRKYAKIRKIYVATVTRKRE
jgi:predicted amidophosphoribosyltransferase